MFETDSTSATSNEKNVVPAVLAMEASTTKQERPSVPNLRAFVHLMRIAPTLLSQRLSPKVTASPRIHIPLSAEEELKAIGTYCRKNDGEIKVQSSICAVDVSREGVRTITTYTPCTPGSIETALRRLPEISYGSTRIILRSCSSRNDTGQGNGRLELLGLHGILNHDGEAPSSQTSTRDMKARAFDLWDLQNLWQASLNQSNRPLYAQTNVLEALVESSRYNLPNSEVARSNGEILHSTIQNCPRIARNTMLFGRHSIEILECVSATKTRFLSENRAESKLTGTLLLFESHANRFQVTFTFPTLPISFTYNSEELVADQFSLLQYHFLRFLTSSNSATQLLATSFNIPAGSLCRQMITVDFLRACLECQMIFASQITPAALHGPVSTATLPAIEDLSNMARDLDRAIQHTLKSAELSASPLAVINTAPPFSTNLRSLALETTAKLTSLKTKISDLQSRITTAASLRATTTTQNTSTYILILLLVVSAFLPFLLSAQILSMSTQAKDLGYLWYDWVSLLSFLVIGMFVLYGILNAFLGMGMGMAAHTPAPMGEVLRCIQSLEGKFAGDDLDAAFSYVQEVAALFASFDKSWSWSRSRQLILFLFTIASIVSSIVGMFIDFHLALKVLGYGAAGALALMILASSLEVVCFMSWCRYSAAAKDLRSTR